MAGGQIRFRDSTGAEQTAARLHLSSSGHLFALTSSGELFGLADEHPRSWQQVALPPLGVSTEPLILDERGVRIVGFAPDGRIVSVSRDSTIDFWTTEGKPTRELFDDLGFEQILSIAFSRDGTRISAVGNRGTVRQWPLRDKSYSDFSMALPTKVRAAAFSPDGKRVVLSGDGKIRAFTLDRGFALAGEINEVAISVAFSPDGTRIVFGAEDGTIKLWTVKGNPKVLMAKAEAGATTSVAFSPDGAAIVSGGADGTLRLWTNEMKPAAEPFEGHGGLVTSVAFSPDGTRIVSGDLDGTIRLWTLQGHPLATLRGHGGPVTSVAFSPDGARILTGGRDGPLRLWGLAQLLGAPFVQSVTSFSDGALWTVGSQGYAAYSRDGRFWESQGQADETDLIAVAAIGPNTAMALTAKNTLLPLSRTQQQQQHEKPAALAGGGEQARSVAVPPAFNGRLRALAFVNANSGWVAGDDGLILHTADGGGNWSKPLYSKDGLTLSDLYIEPSHVGWAVGTYADGRQTVIAANPPEMAGGADSWHELPHHLGPWYFFLGIPALLLSALLLVRLLRAEPPPPQESIEEVATSDQPLRWNEPNARSLKPLARGLSRFLRNINTQPPLTLAITGRWGSGKSSLMNLLMSDLQHYGGRAVWFNAWHHHEEEHLLAALFEAIRRDAPPSWWFSSGLLFRVRLAWMRFRRPLLSIFYIALFAAIALITLHLSLPAFRAEELGRIADRVVGFVGQQVAGSWPAAISVALAGSGGVALFSLWLRGKLVALPANPAKLVSTLARRASLGDFSDKLAFRHKFGKQFGEVCTALLTRTSPGLVILIDDLDRCAPEDVLKILEAVNYLVSVGPCIVVLGMDRRQIEYCVGLGFEKLVEGLPDDELIYVSDETPDKSGKQRAFARHYLEKLINIEVPVPALDDAATDALLLRGIHEPSPETGDVPGWLRASKQLVRAAFQVSRVGLVAVAAGILLTWGAEWLREPGIAIAPAPTAVASRISNQLGKDQTNSESSVAEQKQKQGSQPGTFTPAQVAVKAISTEKLPDARLWLWWGPTALLTGIALLFGIAAAAQRERRIVQDSPQFAKALQAVKPLLIAANATPRAIKRYQNRMRYLAARLRPAAHDPDWMDSLLHWVGGRLGRPLVPAVWFEEQPRSAIDEPALILLGVVELLAPKAFANPAQLFNALEHGTPGEKLTDEQIDAWSKVRNAFTSQILSFPTAAEIALYATFVSNRGRKVPSYRAEIVPFSRDTSEKT